MAVSGIDLGKYKLGWHDSTDDYVYAPKKGLNEAVVRDISGQKDEPEWMTKFRLNALKRFERKPMLEWFATNMPDIDFDDIYYYLKPTEGQVADWDMLPESMQKTYEKLGIPEAERKYLAGVTAQFESEVVYHKNREDLEQRGILFTSMDVALREYPELVREHFGTVIPPGDNKFAALNSAVWSGGSFIYVPPGVHVEMPLQAYFRINAENAGQFERTLIIADEGVVGALRRGLLGAGVLHRLAALRGGRAHRQARRAHPLHDHPELVAERLQPRHQAGAGRDRGHRRVDRRQPRLQAHDEVPRGRDDGPEGARRGAVGRLRRRRPAPGRRAPR